MTRINTNVSSVVARKALESGNIRLAESLNRLATARRVNTGRDDPAALMAGEELQSQITTLAVAVESNSRTDLMLNTADSSLEQISTALGDVRELAVASANTGAMSPEEIQANQAMIDSAVQAVDRIANTASFAGRRLFDGSVTVQVSPDGQTTLNLPSVDSAALGQTGGPGDQSLAGITSGGANSVANGRAAETVAIVDRAASQITTLRAQIGAFQKRGLQSSNDVMSDTVVNLTAARSQIIDADFAAETSRLVQNQILVQAGTSSLAIANQRPRGALALLG